MWISMWRSLLTAFMWIIAFTDRIFRKLKKTHFSDSDQRFESISQTVVLKFDK